MLTSIVPVMMQMFVLQFAIRVMQESIQKVRICVPSICDLGSIPSWVSVITTSSPHTLAAQLCQQTVQLLDRRPCK